MESIQNDPEESFSRNLLQKIQRLRAKIAPPQSVRDQCLNDIIKVWQMRSLTPFGELSYRIRRDVSWRIKVFLWQFRLRFKIPKQGKVVYIDEVSLRQTSIQPHQANIEIIICVHNALDDVRRCLDALIQYTSQPYQLILIDDGSQQETQRYLTEFAAKSTCTLLRNEVPQGYTLAANQGLRHTSAEYIVLLNSDTIVTTGWLDRLVDCAASDPKIGLVGPLSNTASWQSIPEIEFQGDWATNDLPDGLTIEDIGRLLDQYSARLYLPIPFLNGFCLLIRHQVLAEIGYFDEQNFGAGYGEENDYALRARKAGWQLALADNTYVYHAQSRSYSDKKRRQLSERANELLAKKHGRQIIDEGVSFCRRHRVLEGIRATSRAMLDRQEWIKRGKSQFAGRRFIFILPVFRPGGGANIVIDEAQAMRHMGVDVRLFNLTAFKEQFEESYPALNIPTLFGEPDHLADLAQEYDALVATFHTSVRWLAALKSPNHRAVFGYYIQDFEPYMYAEQAEGYQKAWESYTLIPDLIQFTKTEWTRQEVKRQTGVEATVVGPSFDLDLFRPRPRSGPEWPERPLRIAAMVRAGASYRQPNLTMQVLQQAAETYGRRVEIKIFGTNLNDPYFSDLPHDFPWELAGILNPRQVAHFLNDVDIFVDFSAHQAMGLTALEAMACGVAVVVPKKGGARSFAKDEGNSLIVDTFSQEACWHGLQRLIEDHQLRSRLQRQAIFDVAHYFPERPAFNILSTLFDSEKT